MVAVRLSFTITRMANVRGAPIQERLRRASLIKFNPVFQNSIVHNILFEILFKQEVNSYVRHVYIQSSMKNT